MFPTITNIGDVLPHIEGLDEFVVATRSGYQYIDYNYTKSDSFDTPMLRECRGLKFDIYGNLIARPFHKFFNLAEKPDETPPFGDDTVVMEKLDGSMIHPCLIDGEVVMMTRGGISAQAEKAMELIKADAFDFKGGYKVFLDYVSGMLRSGITPIFEFTGPSNPHVLKYDKDRLTLIAARRMRCGSYIHHSMLETYKTLGWDVVKTYDHSLSDMKAFVEHTRSLKDMEGYVVMSGQWLGKMKADDYVLRHRARDSLLFEKDVMKLVLEDKVDDVVGMLSEEEVRRLTYWTELLKRSLFWEGIELQHIAGELIERSGNDRAAYAAAVKEEDGPLERSVLFACFDGKSALQSLRDHALKKTATTAQARAFLDYFGIPEWKPIQYEPTN